MNHFYYQDQQLYAENISLSDIAKQYGTPCYVYSKHAIETSWKSFDKGFGSYPHRICYAVKANSNIGILHLLAKLGSGFDIVSLGELERVLLAGGDPQKIVFSGVCKTEDEIIRALDVNIFCFNVESIPEIERLQNIAKQKNKIANIALRVNPNVDARTHPYIATGLEDNKFGIYIDETLPLCEKIASMSHLKLVGLACHIGSQLTEIEPFIEATQSLLSLNQQLVEKNIKLNFINLGGGLGVCYQNETPPNVENYIHALLTEVKSSQLDIILEPGRAIVANAGILLTRVEYLKHTRHKNFAIVDAGMNDLLRPALYEAWQAILPVKKNLTSPYYTYDIVGPVCESADFMGKDRKLNVSNNELLAICTAGAYGFSMSSNYNSRPRVTELLVDNQSVHILRQRETFDDLFLNEKIALDKIKEYL